jgi:hypothetical protein
MNGATITGWVSLGVVTSDWDVAGTGDYNGDGQTDIVWENTTTGVRGLWLMNGTAFASWINLGQVGIEWTH